MQIPAELRVKILRMLLKSPQALLTEKEHEECQICDKTTASPPIVDNESDTDDDDFNKKAPPGCSSEGFFDQACFNLSSQILQSCQQLHAEGTAILYGENSLSVLFEDHDCHILDGMTEVPESSEWCCWDCSIPDLALATLERSLSCRSDLDYVDIEKRASNLRNMYGWLQNFSRIELSMNVNRQVEVYIAARILRDFVSAEDVTLVPTLIRKQLPNITWLQSLRSLRCQSFKFPECLAADREVLLSHAETICGTEEYTDLLPLWNNLAHDDDGILHHLPQIDGKDYHNRDVRGLISDLEDAIIEEDVPKVQAIRDQLSTSAKSWLERWRSEEPGWVMKAASRKAQAIEHDYFVLVEEVEAGAKI